MARKDMQLRGVQELTGISVTELAGLGVRFDAREIEIILTLCRRAFDRGAASTGDTNES